VLNMEHLQALSRLPDGWLWLIPALPFFGAVLNGFLTLMARNKPGRVPEWLLGIIACSGAFGSFLFAWTAFSQFRALPESSVLI